MWSAGLGFRPPRYLWLQGRQAECKMAHSCRWRFPARPGGSSNSGTGKRAGRTRVTASLRTISGAQSNTAGLGPGFDAALQVSSVIGSNLQKFRDVLGESSDSSSAEVSIRQAGSFEYKDARHSSAWGPFFTYGKRSSRLRFPNHHLRTTNLSLAGCSVNLEFTLFGPKLYSNAIQQELYLGST